MPILRKRKAISLVQEIVDKSETVFAQQLEYIEKEFPEFTLYQRVETAVHNAFYGDDETIEMINSHDRSLLNSAQEDFLLNKIMEHTLKV